MPALRAQAVRPLIVLGALSLAFVIYTEAVAAGAETGLDRTVEKTAAGLWWPPLQLVAQVIAVIGGFELTTALALGIAIALLATGFRVEAAAVLVFPLLMGLEALYKHVVAHPQPLAAHPDGPSLVTMLYRQTLTLGGSYPSGHMMRSVFVYGLGAFVVWRMAPPSWGWVAVLAAAGVIGLMALDRVYLGVHWQSDVVGGLMLGGAALAGAIAWLDRPVRAGD